MLVTTLKKESLKQDIQPSNGLTMKTPGFQHDPDLMIRINDVNFYYGETQALKNINMILPEKKITSFIGPSGCGKSTLLRCLNRMNDLVEGTRMEGDILIGGMNTNDPALDVSELRKNIGMVFQKFNPFPKTIFENIAYGPRIHGMKDKKKLTDIVEKSLKSVALWDEVKDRLNSTALALSGGQQQRTALARALVKDSDLILLDEPLANLDFKLREELREELPKLFEDRDCIVVYATTEPLDALMIGGNTATLLEGKVIQYGKTLDVYNKPENLTSAKVFSDPPMNVADIKKSGDTFKLNNNNVQWKSNVKIKDGNYKIGIRPHNITTYKEGNNSIEINGKVLISEISGSESLIHFTNGNLNWVSLSNGIQQKNIGEETKLYMNVDEFLYFDQNNSLVNNG